MAAPVLSPPVAPPDPGSPGGPPVPWVTALGSGAAVLLAGAPVSAVVQGTSWPGHALTVVAAVVVVGLLLHRTRAAVIAAGQCGGILVLLTAQFAQDGILGLLPGPAALREFGALVAGAGAQIETSTAPVPPTPEILFLVTAAFGLLAVGVYLAAVCAATPAAGGVPLLAVFAVPTALADDLLPWWAVASAAAGFGLLLVARDGAGRQVRGGAMLVAGAAVLALVVGAGAGIVGTAGRFDTAGPGGGTGTIGLSPFTVLRGQLEQSATVELFRVRDLPRPTYLRALTLRDYVPGAGWQATRPDPGPALPGPIGTTAATPGEVADVEIENVSFRDYWLPLYGVPLEVSGLADGRWAYDPRSNTAYTARPRREDGWRQRAVLSAPTAAQLRAEGPGDPGADYLAVEGVDARVGALAAQVVAGRPTAFDRAMALQDYFTGPESQFAYSLATAPGGTDDALVEFLTVGKVGYCEQYASAMAVMLRTVGVPARVAVGFTAGRDAGDYRSLGTSDAHAWVEAWFPATGWTTFDPTPLTDGRTITPPYVLEARAQAAGAAGAATAEPLPLDDPAEQQPTPEPVAPEEAAPAGAAPGSGAGGLPWWPAWLVAGLALLALVPAAGRAWDGRRRMAAVARGGPDAAGAGWAELLAASADRGAPSPPTDTVRAAARRLMREHRLDGPAQQAMRQVVAAVESSWYGGGRGEPGALDEPVRAVRAAIAAASPLTVRERLLPRSVLGRRRPPDP